MTLREALADMAEAEDLIAFLEDARSEGEGVPDRDWRRAEEQLWDAEAELADFPTCTHCLEKVDFDVDCCCSNSTDSR